MAVIYDAKRRQSTNDGYLYGTVRPNFFDVKFDGKDYITSVVEVKRLSGNVDAIPVLFTNKLYSFYSHLQSDRVGIIGSYLTFLTTENNASKIHHYFLANSIDTDEDKYLKRNNSIHLAGHLTKNPWTLKLTNGKELTYVQLAVNTPKRDNFICCYARPYLAKHLIGMQASDYIEIYGRIQSRECGEFDAKKAYEDPQNGNVAYQVSIAKIESIGYKGHRETYIPVVNPEERD